MKLLTKVLAVLAIGLGMAVVGPSGAQASEAQAAAVPTAERGGNGCAGVLIDQFNHSYGGRLVAITYLYWDGTYNCVASVKANDFYGKSTRMNLDIWSDKGGNGNDAGYFQYRAGPAKVNGQNACINLELDMWDLNGGPNILQDHIPASGYFHCD